MNMQKKKSTSVLADKAWNLLRLALLSARKGAVMKRGLKVKGLGDKAPSDQIHYLERQLSFDRSPDFHVKKDRLTGSMRFLFPCLGTKTVEFHNDIADDEDGRFHNGNYSGRESYPTEEEEEYNGCENKSHLEDEGIDSRAEKFIAEFYGQISVQDTELPHYPP
ncbi:hypothetical protein DITRI_Ditri18aG0060600 [Diplodiscus trichospermus]